MGTKALRPAPARRPDADPFGQPRGEAAMERVDTLALLEVEMGELVREHPRDTLGRRAEPGGEEDAAAQRGARGPVAPGEAGEALRRGADVDGDRTGEGAVERLLDRGDRAREGRGDRGGLGLGARLEEDAGVVRRGDEGGGAPGDGDGVGDVR